MTDPRSAPPSPSRVQPLLKFNPRRGLLWVGFNLEQLEQLSGELAELPELDRASSPILAGVQETLQQIAARQVRG